jgi:hypothetical protein
MKRYKEIYRVSLQKLSLTQMEGELGKKRIDLIGSELKELLKIEIVSQKVLVNQI